MVPWQRKSHLRSALICCGYIKSRIWLVVPTFVLSFPYQPVSSPGRVFASSFHSFLLFILAFFVFTVLVTLTVPTMQFSQTISMLLASVLLVLSFADATPLFYRRSPKIFTVPVKRLPHEAKDLHPRIVSFVLQCITHLFTHKFHRYLNRSQTVVFDAKPECPVDQNLL